VGVRMKPVAVLSATQELPIFSEGARQMLLGDGGAVVGLRAELAGVTCRGFD
jgi:hypothetical protein